MIEMAEGATPLNNLDMEGKLNIMLHEKFL